MKGAIQILIVDEHAVVREGLRAFIGTEAGMEVIGEAADGETAAQQCAVLQPDVIVLDLTLRHREGLDAIREIRQNCPKANILVLTNTADEKCVLAAMRAGVLGYMLKDATTEDVIRAIRDVHRGQLVLHPSVAYVLLRALRMQNEAEETALQSLTNREIEVLQLVAQGFTNQVIAAQLGIDERTVRVHVTHILHKLDLRSRTQATLFALRYGLATLE